MCVYALPTHLRVALFALRCSSRFRTFLIVSKSMRDLETVVSKIIYIEVFFKIIVFIYTHTHIQCSYVKRKKATRDSLSGFRRFIYNFISAIKNSHLFQTWWNGSNDVCTGASLLITLNLSHVTLVNSLLYVASACYCNETSRRFSVARVRDPCKQQQRKHRLKREAYALNEHRQTFASGEQVHIYTRGTTSSVAKTYGNGAR